MSGFTEGYGERIRALFERSPYRTRLDFAKAIDPDAKSAERVNAWIRGETEPRAKSLKRLVELTGADPDWIKTGRGMAPWERDTLEHIRARVDQIANHLGLPAIPADDRDPAAKAAAGLRGSRQGRTARSGRQPD